MKYELKKTFITFLSGEEDYSPCEYECHCEYVISFIYSNETKDEENDITFEECKTYAHECLPIDKKSWIVAGVEKQDAVLLCGARAGNYCHVVVMFMIG